MSSLTVSSSLAVLCQSGHQRPARNKSLRSRALIKRPEVTEHVWDYENVRGFHYAPSSDNNYEAQPSSSLWDQRLATASFDYGSGDFSFDLDPIDAPMTDHNGKPLPSNPILVGADFVELALLSMFGALSMAMLWDLLHQGL